MPAGRLPIKEEEKHKSICISLSPKALRVLKQKKIYNKSGFIDMLILKKARELTRQEIDAHRQQT